MARLRPSDSADLRDIVAAAAAAEEPLELIAGGTKRGLGRPPKGTPLDLSALAGIVDYQPDELILKARPGTSVAEVEHLAAQKGQALAFEPPDLGVFYGGHSGKQTLGGVIASNQSGPRRVKAGAARDHLLGFSAVNGRGESFKAGGSVVKNVTGYDLCKLITGSFGTLAALTEVTVKILPAAESSATLWLSGLADGNAIALLTEVLSSPFELTGLVHLHAPLAESLHEDFGGAAATFLRVEAPAVTLSSTLDRLRGRVSALRKAEIIADSGSLELWRGIRDLKSFGGPDGLPVWRLSVPPAAAASVVDAIGSLLPSEAIYDWAGARIWVRPLEDREDGGAAIMDKIALAAGGFAVFVRGPETLRESREFCAVGPPALKTLTARIKDSFDPRRIFNRGRISAGF